MQPFPDLLSSEKPESTFASYPLNMRLLKFMDLLAVCRQDMCWRVMVSDGLEDEHTIGWATTDGDHNGGNIQSNSNEGIAQGYAKGQAKQ